MNGPNGETVKIFIKKNSDPLGSFNMIRNPSDMI